MVNATSWEWAWSGIFATATIFALWLLGFMVARLVRRYQRKRNGGGRLLAWKDTLIVAFLTLGCMPALALGVIAMLAPQGQVDAADLGPVEVWAREWVNANAVPSLVALGVCVVAVLVSILACEMLIDRYLRTTADPDGAEHPDATAARAAALELALAARLAAEQVAAAAAAAAAEVAATAARIAAEARPVAAVAEAAATNTEALRENTEAVRENTGAQGGGETHGPGGAVR